MGYIYQADTYCEECGDKICSALRAKGLAPEDELDTRSYDSDNFPKPADIAHEESDVPEHCADCGKFLHNPLTSDGYKYVREYLQSLPKLTSIGKLVLGGHEALAEWAFWYNFRYWDEEDCADYFQDHRKRTPGWYSDEAH